MKINDLTHKIIGCAFKVHNVLGPGFLEKVYENALRLEFDKLGVAVQQQPRLIVRYEGHPVGVFFPDFWIDQQLIIEVKAVKTLLPEHEAQLVHYLVATGIDDGLLVNFGPSVQVKRKFREYKSKDRPCAAFLAVSLE